MMTEDYGIEWRKFTDSKISKKPRHPVMIQATEQGWIFLIIRMQDVGLGGYVNDCIPRVIFL